MKKAALRRVIIYVLVFSLTFTSVSTAVVRPVEVQASTGVMEGWEIFVGILSSLGFFSSSSSAGQTYYEQFINYISGTSDLGTQVYSMFSSLPDDLVEQGVDQATAKQMCNCLANALINIFDRNLLTNDSDFNTSYEYKVNGDVVGEVSIELSNGHLKMVESFSCVKYALIFECDPKKFVQNKKLTFSLAEGKIRLVDKEATEEAIKTYTLNLVNFLKKVVFNWIKSQTKGVAKNKLMIDNTAISSFTEADSSCSVRDNIMLYLTDINSKYFTSSSTSDSYHTPLVLKKYLITNNIIFNNVYNEQALVFPSSFISIYYFRTVSSYTRGFLELYFTEDLSGYDLVLDSNNLYKFDSDGNSSPVLYGKFARVYDTSVSLSTDLGFSLSDSIYRNGFSDYKLLSYSDGASEWRSFQLSGIDLSKYYTSIDNYINHISFYDEARNYFLYGSSDYSSSDESDVYVPDSTFYDDLVKKIETNFSNSEQLAAALAAAQAANAKALEDVKDSIDSGNEVSASFLQKILDAINTVDKSANAILPLDTKAVINSFAGTADVISDIDKLLTEKLPVIGSMADVVTGSLPSIDDIKEWAQNVATIDLNSIADSGLKSLAAIDNLGDKIIDAVAPISLLDKLDGAVDGIALDNAKLLENIEKAVNGEKALTVSIAPAVQDPDDQDDFNFGFYKLFYFLFLILVKIIMIFCHCLELLFTIQSVKAYPYFLNTGMVQGIEWMKNLKISGELLNVSLYDFMFFLVRLFLVFSVIRLVRKYTDKLH